MAWPSASVSAGASGSGPASRSVPASASGSVRESASVPASSSAAATAPRRGARDRARCKGGDRTGDDRRRRRARWRRRHGRRRRGGRGRRDERGVELDPAARHDEGHRDAEGQDQQRDRGDDRRRGDRPAPDDRRRHVGHHDRSPQVARAVDVAARQADELLLAEGLRDGVAHRRASIGGVGRLDRHAERVVVVRRPQEWADPRVRRTVVEERQPRLGRFDRRLRPSDRATADGRARAARVGGEREIRRGALARVRVDCLGRTPRAPRAPASARMTMSSHPPRACDAPLPVPCDVRREVPRAGRGAGLGSAPGSSATRAPVVGWAERRGV